MKPLALLLLPWLAVITSCGGSPSSVAPAIEIPIASAEPAEAPSKEEPRARRPAKVARPALPPTSDPTNLADAEAAFAEGRRLMAEGKLPEACTKFDESFRLDPAIGTMFNLALCEEKLGDTQRACELLRRASAAAQQAGQVERERFAQAKIAALGCP